MNTLESPKECEHVWRVLHAQDPRVQLQECTQCYEMAER